MSYDRKTDINIKMITHPNISTLDSSVRKNTRLYLEYFMNEL